MKQKHQQIANLVINYASCLGIDLLSFTDDHNELFTEQYLADYLDATINASTDKVPGIYIYIEMDSGIALLVEQEEWNNNPSEDQDEYDAYTLQFPECTIHLEINQ